MPGCVILDVLWVTFKDNIHRFPCFLAVCPMDAELAWVTAEFGRLERPAMTLCFLEGMRLVIDEWGAGRGSIVT